MNSEAATKAIFHPAVHFGSQGARVSSPVWTLLRTMILGTVFVVLTATALAAMFFGHAIFFGIVFLICAAGVMAVLNNVTSAWSGICPYCRSEIFARAANNVRSHGFDCPVCKERVILRDQHFTTVVTIGNTPPVISTDFVAKNKTSNHSRFGFAFVLGILALIIVAANVLRIWF